MSTSLPGNGGVPPSNPPIPPLTPDERFRCRIGCISDSLTRMLDVLAAQSVHHANTPYMHRQLDLCIQWLAEMRLLMQSFPLPQGDVDDDEDDTPLVPQNAGIMFVDQPGPLNGGA